MNRNRIKIMSKMLVFTLLFCLITAGSPISFATASAESLTGLNKTVYDLIKPEIQKMAQGLRNNTEVSIPLSDLGIETKYYLSELGVDSPYIYIDGVPQKNPDLITAFTEKMNQVFGSYDGQLVLQALWRSLPYDFYWAKEYANFNLPNSSSLFIYYDYIDGQYIPYVLLATDALIFSFPVSEPYAAGEFEIDIAKLAVGLTIPARAKAIVSEAASLSDYEKLEYYAKKIVELTDYHWAAASGSTGDYYDNPWNPIWALDEDPDTLVVCEGYAKAFKYLCDLTSFNSSAIKCFCVSGSFSAPGVNGPHMWNLVHMEDGKNYLVDITNCDTGASFNNALFMQAPEYGNTGSGYVYNINNRTYRYLYDTDSKLLYSDAELTLSKTAYTSTSTTPSPTVSVSPVVSPEVSPEITPEVSSEPDVSLSPSPEPSTSQTPAPSNTEVPTSGENPDVSVAPSTSSTPVPSTTLAPSNGLDPNISNTPVPSNTATPTSVTTPSPVISATPSSIPTPSVAAVPTSSQLPSPTAALPPNTSQEPSPSNSVTPTSVTTPSPVITITPSSIPTPSVAVVPTSSQLPSPTATLFPSASLEPSPSSSVTPTSVTTPSPVVSATPSSIPTPTAGETPYPSKAASPSSTSFPSPSAIAPSSSDTEDMDAYSAKPLTQEIVIIAIILLAVFTLVLFALAVLLIKKSKNHKNV